MEVILSGGIGHPNQQNHTGGNYYENPDYCPEHPTTTVVVPSTTQKPYESPTTLAPTSTTTTSEIPVTTEAPTTTVPVSLIPPISIERSTTTAEVVVPSQPAKELAETGANTMPLLSIAFGITALGVAARRAARRNR